MQISEASSNVVQVKVKGGNGEWCDVKGTHRDVHDAHAHAVNLILGGVDEARVQTTVELQAVGRRRRGRG